MSVPDQGSNSHLLHWRQILVTGYQEESSLCLFLSYPSLFIVISNPPSPTFSVPPFYSSIERVRHARVKVFLFQSPVLLST